MENCFHNDKFVTMLSEINNCLGRETELSYVM
jgi:hypothetical protein